MSWRSKSIIVLFFAVALGCNDSTVSRSASAPVSKAPLTEIAGADLEQFIESSELPVLVEFGVDHNCGRCDSMKPQVTLLADKYKGNAKVLRVDFSSNVELVTKYGGTICPTYALFEPGQLNPVFVQSFPTSSDMLESSLLSVLAFLDDE